MSDPPRILDSLDVLLEHLVIDGEGLDSRDGRLGLYREFALARAAGVLRADEDESVRRQFELRLRLAMHLSPQSAIRYEHSNPVPRWRLISKHLVSAFGRDERSTEPLAREIALVLDNWDSSRESVTQYADFLANRDGWRCAACHVALDGSAPITLARQDEYKPYFLSPEELLSAEVDHVNAVSALGTNLIDNLQLLCRLCNQGKGDGLGLDVRHEATSAGVQIGAISVSHRARMLYYVIARDGGRCALCGSETDELTIRPLVEHGGFVRSNFQAVCVNCGFAGPDRTLGVQ